MLKFFNIWYDINLTNAAELPSNGHFEASNFWHNFAVIERLASFFKRSDCIATILYGPQNLSFTETSNVQTVL